MDDKPKLSIEQMLGMAQELSMGLQCRDIMQGSIDNLKQSLDPNGLSGTIELPNNAYFVVIDGTQQGPCSLPEMIERVRSGAISPDTYVWKSGLKEWIPARRMEELAGEWNEPAALTPSPKTIPQP